MRLSLSLSVSMSLSMSMSLSLSLGLSLSLSMSPTRLVRLVGIACPDASTKAVDGVVGDGYGLLLSLERRDARHRAVPVGGGEREAAIACEGNDGMRGRAWAARDAPKDLLLEDLHVVRAVEDGGLDVIAAVDDVVHRAPSEHSGALCRADTNVVLNALVLLLRDLMARSEGRVGRRGR